MDTEEYLKAPSHDYVFLKTKMRFCQIGSYQPGRSVLWSIESELGHVLSFELKLELVRNQGDELRIGGLSFGVGHGVAEEALEGIQIPSVPGYLNGMANGPLYSTWRGAEVLGYLRIEYLGDGVRGLSSPRRGFQE